MSGPAARHNLLFTESRSNDQPGNPSYRHFADPFSLIICKFRYHSVTYGKPFPEAVSAPILSAMRRIILLILILATAWSLASGQDMIITNGGDTIHCRITRVTRCDILFRVITPSSITHHRLPLSSLLSYTVRPGGNLPPGQASSNEQPVPDTEEALPLKAAGLQGESPLSKLPQGTLRISLNGGMGLILASSTEAEARLVQYGNTPREAAAYYRDLKGGWYGSGDVTWLPGRQSGVGIRHKFFSSNASTEGFFNPGDYENVYFSELSEQIYVNYTGLSLLTSYPFGPDKQYNIYVILSGGITLYRDEMKMLYQGLLITGNAFGVDAAIGFEYRVSPLISVGTEISGFRSRLTKLNMKSAREEKKVTLAEGEYEDLTRLEISAGIRIYLWNR